MPSNQNRATATGNSGKAARQARAQQAIAADMKKRGGNPVRVADLSQRHATGGQKGQPIRTGLLSKLFG